MGGRGGDAGPSGGEIKEGGTPPRTINMFRPRLAGRGSKTHTPPYPPIPRRTLGGPGGPWDPKPPNFLCLAKFPGPFSRPRYGGYWGVWRV
jgi:hypothetical protein